MDDELKEQSWMVQDNKIINIFKETDSDAWKAILESMGGDYRLWANAPNDPLMN